LIRGLIGACAVAYGTLVLPHFHYGEAIGVHAGCVAGLAGAWVLAGGRDRRLTLRRALAALATIAALLAGTSHVVFGPRELERETDRSVEHRLGLPPHQWDQLTRDGWGEDDAGRRRSTVEARGPGWGRAVAALHGVPFDIAAQPPRVFCGESHVMFLGRHDAFQHARDRRESERRCLARAEELRARLLTLGASGTGGSPSPPARR
jgi:hypothetical protein